MRTGHKLRFVRIFYGMDITQLKRGERAVILSVEAPATLKERLSALNLRTGAEVFLLKTSLFKRTYLVRAGSVVALRREVAQCVKITRR